MSQYVLIIFVFLIGVTALEHFSLSSACREPGLSQDSMLFDKTGSGGGGKSLLSLIMRKMFFKGL